MKCMECGRVAKVKDSRRRGPNRRYRRYSCRCGNLFSSVEITVPDGGIGSSKNFSTLEQFFENYRSIPKEQRDVIMKLALDLATLEKFKLLKGKI